MGTRRDALMALVAPGMAAATPAAAAAATAASPGGATLAVGLFTSLKTLSAPSDVQVVQTSGYAVAGIGGARYIASSSQGETSYRTRSADGRWFELAETDVTPQMFGAMGGVDGRRIDDTAAMQAWLDYLKLPLIAGPNGVPKTVRGRLPTGTYLVTRSLDFTGDNDRIGGRTIIGDDLQNTGIPRAS